MEVPPRSGAAGTRAPSSPDAAPPRSSRLGSGPPSEPRIATTKPIDGDGDRAPRIQIVAALLLVLVLVVVPLYLWRRPRVDAGDAAPTASQSTVVTPISGAADAGADATGSSLLTLGEMKMIECHDPGPKRTAPSDCDRLPQFERAVTDAIRAEAACGAGAGEVLWIVDVSTLRKKTPVLLSVTKDGHALKSGKVATDCTTAVKRSLSAATLDPGHAHARYKMEVTASYR